MQEKAKAGGRPSKYSIEMLNKANEYFDNCLKENALPFVDELALILDVCDDTLLNWGKEHGEFLATLERLRKLQKVQLMKGGLNKAYQSNVVLFLLKANHGLDEKKKDKDRMESFKVEFVSPVKTIDQVIAEAEASRKDCEKEDKAA
jgi:hypothetical protein